MYLGMIQGESFSPEGFDFSGASAGAMQDIGGGQAPAPAGGAAAPAGGQAPAGGGQQAPAGGQQQVTQVGDGLYEVKVNGRPVRVTLDELRNGYSRQQDYTSKTMALSDRERQYNDYIGKLEGAYAQAQRILNDPRVQQHIATLQAQVPSDEPVTAAQVQRLVAQQLMAANQNISAEQENRVGEAEVRILATQYTHELDNKMSQILETPEHAILKTLPGIREVIRTAIREREPAVASIDEAKQVAVEAAQRITKALREQLSAEQKSQAAAQAQQLTGIERPGGSQVPAIQQNPGWKLGDKGLREAAIADVLASVR